MFRSRIANRFKVRGGANTVPTSTTPVGTGPTVANPTPPGPSPGKGTVRTANVDDESATLSSVLDTRKLKQRIPTYIFKNKREDGVEEYIIRTDWFCYKQAHFLYLLKDTFDKNIVKALTKNDYHLYQTEAGNNNMKTLFYGTNPGVDSLMNSLRNFTSGTPNYKIKKTQGDLDLYVTLDVKLSNYDGMSYVLTVSKPYELVYTFTNNSTVVVSQPSSAPPELDLLTSEIDSS